MVTVRIVLLFIALVCFIGAALSMPTGRVNLIGLGLALWIMAQIAG